MTWLTNDAKCTLNKIRDCHGTSSIQQGQSLHQQTGLIFTKENKEIIHLGHSFYGAETWTLRKVDQKYLGSFETWCWRRMEKISCTDRVRNEEVLLRVKEERNVMYK